MATAFSSLTAKGGSHVEVESEELLAIIMGHS